MNVSQQRLSKAYAALGLSSHSGAHASGTSAQCLTRRKGLGMSAAIISQLAALWPELFVLEVHIPVLLCHGFGVNTQEGAPPAPAGSEPDPAASFALRPQEAL